MFTLMSTIATRAIIARHPRRLATVAQARCALRDADLLHRKAFAASERDDADDSSEDLYLGAAAQLLARVAQYCATGCHDPWCGYEHLREMTDAAR